MEKNTKKIRELTRVCGGGGEFTGRFSREIHQVDVWPAGIHWRVYQGDFLEHRFYVVRNKQNGYIAGARITSPEPIIYQEKFFAWPQ